ncbi:MAG: voltage-gated chloride channel family protein [Cytophagales bacterium]|nr:voltage-gated chloride channel family protein [Bernardetiaceae bacterium]MDW8210980.1 voltage-gated chloride channel family protein [Cytophagales bacterium]
MLKNRRIEQVAFLLDTFRWLFFALLIGVLAGSASAFFLIALQWVSDFRENHLWVIALLPLGGFVIGWLYYRYGQDVARGNNQIIDEFHQPRRIIPFKMAPLVLFGTLVTHLFGGSAGREGTAVQMGAAIADQFTRIFSLKPRHRRILLVMGISAGFSSVFGTPLAGAVFALEVLILGRMRYEAILPAFFAATVGNYTCHLWQVAHTHYAVSLVPEMNPTNFLWTILAGICFGLTALFFSKMSHFWQELFRNYIHYPPLRPVVGGVIIALLVGAFGTTKYIGLGIPTIVAAFSNTLPAYDFLIKTIATTFTLGAGFKGGEVTPLFFVGATLGNALAQWMPLPMALLAGMGFVGVFAGATNTPIACTLMGIELFGAESGLYIGLACVVSYIFSGHTGIYSSQIVGSAKHMVYLRKKSRRLEEL